MDFKKQALDYHKKYEGKLAISAKSPLENKADLSLAYSPGVAEPCIEIDKNPEAVYDYTAKGNFVAVVSNGTAVLGLGNLGASASIPVMEGKSVLFKLFGGIDTIPICIDSEDEDEIVNTVKLISSTLGGINLEDIKAPECFEIERRLKKDLDIPVFHDDQHGTAVVVLAGLINALKVVDKKIEDIKIVLNGPGSAGIAITNLLISRGAKNIVVCGRKGALHKGIKDTLTNPYQAKLCEYTNPNNEEGTLKEVLKDADVFIGVSAPNLLDENDIKNMNDDAIVFALANPIPEIMPELAISAGAKVVCTGRSDYPNQVNNVLAFPGIFRGALDVRSKDINDDMKIAAAEALADLISNEQLNGEYVIVDPFDERVAPAVAKKVAQASIDSGLSRKKEITAEMVYDNTKKILNK